MDKKEITVQELLALMAARERVELQIEDVDTTTGYASELLELCKTPYIVKHVYSDYNRALKESYTIIEVAIPY